MRLGVFVAVAALMAAGSGLAEGPESIQLSGASAIVYDETGTALLQGDRDFVLAYAGNPAGTAFAFDRKKMVVRISPDDAPAAWLSCDQVKPSASFCTIEQATRSIRGDASRGTAGSFLKAPPAGLPSCPGDPRCPKIGGR